MHDYANYCKPYMYAPDQSIIVKQPACVLKRLLDDK